jgi:hypothetical protein
MTNKHKFFAELEILKSEVINRISWNKLIEEKVESIK